MPSGRPPIRTSPINEKLKEPKPQSIKDVPRYIKNVTKSFFSRLFYILKLVWETKPWILIVMILFAVLDGVFPVLGAYITANLLNRLADAYSAAKSGTAFTFSSIVILLALQFGYLFLKTIIYNVESIVTRISSELVTNHINHQKYFIILKVLTMPNKLSIIYTD